jgi:uncharacterized DUF497 family protein
MRFDWNPAKARSNLAKHGVSFEEASTVFFDPDALTADDERHSIAEQRWITIGLSARMRVLYVVTTERDDEVIWIISARRATRREVNGYEQAKRQSHRGNS